MSNNYHRSRSDIGSTSTVGNLNNDEIIKKYQKYKQMTKDLIAENEELQQVPIFNSYFLVFNSVGQ